MQNDTTPTRTDNNITVLVSPTAEFIRAGKPCISGTKAMNIREQHQLKPCKHTLLHYMSMTT